jgi:hypothetical protein
MKLLAFIAVLSFAPQTPKPKPAVLHYAPHVCHTRRCGRLWAEHHPPLFHWSPFVLCVFNHEAGDGQATLANARLSTIDFRYNDGHYEGAGNWITTTWKAMGGRTAHAYEASPREQAEVFMRHANPRDWPLSVPACGG